MTKTGWAMFATANLLAGCDRLPGADRYEIKQDSTGRTIRLDKRTGEIMIIEGDKLVPVTPDTTQSQAGKAIAASVEKMTLANLAIPQTVNMGAPLTALGVKEATCRTMWRDGKVFLAVKLTPPPPPPALRPAGPGLSSFHMVFTDGNGFNVVDEPVPLSNVVMVVDDKGKRGRLEINWSVPLSQEAYLSIMSWSLTWVTLQR